MSPDDPRHGTYAGYQAGCHDACCRSAAADYQRRRYLDHQVLGLPPRCVDPTGSRRRIHALQRIGWSAEALSARLGHSRAWLNVTLNRDASRGINQTTAAAITALYEELCMTPGPSDITRRRAIAAGWAPPLAWDDIDDPAEQPKGVLRSPAPTNGIPTRDQLATSRDHRACPRCGVIRETRRIGDGTCGDCKPLMGVAS